jgi:hypothetical protein
VIKDESNLAWIFSPEDQAMFILVSVTEFDTEEEREQYLVKQGWLKK